MIEDVVAQLSCPHCATELALTGNVMVCETGHTFDVARQGYVSLLRGDHRSGTADTAAMVEAREAFLAEGHYEGIADLASRMAVEAVGDPPPGTCVVDLGAGTGYYLARVLDATGMAGIAGIALDVSKHAARRAARAHPRIGSVVADAWQSLPIRGRAAAVVLNVFAPRNPAEMHRILHPDGHAVVIAPEPGHLAELVDAYGLLNVDGRKRERIAAQFDGRFAVEAEHALSTTLHLTPRQAETLVDMGPNAWHAAGRQAAGVALGADRIADRIKVTAAVRAYVLRPV
jgi:23S rRNA (guanine745-N1)-methyltransferase